METFLGLLGVAIFIPCTIALAAVATWLVVKISPSKHAKPEPPST